MTDGRSDGPEPLPKARSAQPPTRRARARSEVSAGGVVLRRVDGRVHALLIRDPYKNWGLPKGHLEDGEDAMSAAEREVREETGLEELSVGPELGRIDWYFRSGGELIHKFSTFFAMHSPHGDPVPEVAEGITACEWRPLDEAIESITYDNAREVLRVAAKRLEAGDLPFDL